MKTKAWKKIQRRINKNIRMLNEGVKADLIFRGRFSIKQVNRKITPYHDRPGFSFLSLVQFTDNETGFTRFFIIEALPNTSGNRQFELNQLCSKFAKFALLALENCISEEV